MYLRAVGGPAGDTAGTAEDEEPDRQGPESWEGAGGQAFPAAAGLGERVRAARVLLDRPLTSYYLIVGITMLLLGLGLVMVLSTASVTDLAYGESPYYDFERQLAGVVIGLPVMWLAARSSPRLFRAAAYPLVAIAVVGLGLTLIHGVGQVQNGAARWIQLGPLQFQPSELAKLALAVWGADLLARKEKLGLLADWRHILVPLMPGRRPAGHARDGRGRPRHHVHPAAHLSRPAVVRGYSGPGVHRAADPDGAGARAADVVASRTGSNGSPGS